MNDLYEELRQRLDDMATGFPATERKIEIKILKQLFSKREAVLFLAMSPMVERSAGVAGRVGGDPAVLEALMEEMAQKGLLFRLKKAGETLYATVPFVPGIFEHQVGQLTRELALDIKDYYEGEFGRTIMAYKHTPLRTIPIDRELVLESPLASYEDVIQIFKQQKKIVVINCVCREWGKMVENTCGKPLETCFYFGSYADYFLDNHTGRIIDAEEAITIVRRNLEETGLVIQVGGGQKPSVVCMCCGDCCNMLLSLKMQTDPAAASNSNYFAVIDPDTCTGCEECQERCQMDAIDFFDSIATINYQRCIGCGTCIFGCEEETIQLKKKPVEDQYTPPATIADAFMDIAAERGKLG